MKGIYQISFLFFTLLFLAACKKENQSKVPSGVYVAGSLNDTAVFWKDGLVTKLPMPFGTSSEAQSVYVTNNAIYIAGTNGQCAALWVNNVLTKLAETGSQAFSVFVSGNDVYVAGVDNGTPVYWKNGTEVKLNLDANATGNYIYDIYVANGDVYVAGAQYFGPPFGQYATPTIWKNSVPTKLISEQTNSFATAVCVSGSDVYVTGGVDGHAILWKNGVQTVLAPIGYATSVFVSGLDVYVGGVSTATSYITSWKNGVATTFSPGNWGLGAPSIFVSNGNVYISAILYDHYGFVQSVYFENNQQTNLGPYTYNEAYISHIGSAACSIFVKK